MMVVRLPQAKIAANSPAISISCFLTKRCGTEMGSAAIKESWSYCKTFFSRKSRRSFLFLKSSILTDRLVQVFYQVATVFNTRADTDQGVAQAIFNSFLLRYRRVRHGGRMTDQGFHTSQTFGKRK